MLVNESVHSIWHTIRPRSRVTRVSNDMAEVLSVRLPNSHHRLGLCFIFRERADQILAELGRRQEPKRAGAPHFSLDLRSSDRYRPILSNEVGKASALHWR